MQTLKNEKPEVNINTTIRAHNMTLQTLQKTQSPVKNWLGKISLLLVAASMQIANAEQGQSLYSQNVHSDMMPELSTPGKHKVGVRTTSIENANYVNVFTQQVEPRSLTLEVWYPSTDDATKAKTTYENELRSGQKFSIAADAGRDIAFDDSQDWPLVVISHGYTGYRTIMFYLGEHLASHGYVVVGIDHTDSTNEDIDFATAPFAGFMSTLINRSRDQQFVLDYFGESQSTQTTFNQDVQWTANSAGVIGYSMGGYGAINTVGACYDFPSELLASFIQSQDEEKIKGMKAALNTCSAGQYPAKLTGSEPATDAKWKAMIAFAPWGGQHKIFSYNSLANITVPSMLVSGDLDDVSIYAGIQDIYAQYQNNDHYMLTYYNARHNIAPHPAPKEAWSVEIDYGHHYEPAWDQQRLNAINEHFSLAMMNCYLKSDEQACTYLDLEGDSNQVNPEGGLSAPWKGFDNRYSTGMAFEANKAKKE